MFLFLKPLTAANSQKPRTLVEIKKNFVTCGWQSCQVYVLNKHIYYIDTYYFHPGSPFYVPICISYYSKYLNIILLVIYKSFAFKTCSNMCVYDIQIFIGP